MSFPSSHLLRLRELSRTVGPLRALWIAPAWSLSRRYLVIARDLDEPIALPEPGQDLWFTNAGPDDFEELSRLDSRLTHEELERRHAMMQVCQLWWREGQIVHFRWFAEGRIFLPFLQLSYQPEDGDYLLYEVFTRADLRVRGIHSLIAGASLRRARGMGYRRMVALCAWWNSPALKVGRKAGFAQVGSVTAWQLGPKRLFTSAGEVSVRGSEMNVGRDRLPSPIAPPAQKLSDPRS